MAYLQFEALGFDKVKTDLSVSYVDHNTIQDGFENADDHKYLETVAAKYGIKFSKPGTESVIRFIWNALCPRKTLRVVIRTPHRWWHRYDSDCRWIGCSSGNGRRSVFITIPEL